MEDNKDNINNSKKEFLKSLFETSFSKLELSGSEKSILDKVNTSTTTTPAQTATPVAPAPVDSSKK